VDKGSKHYQPCPHFPHRKQGEGREGEGHYPQLSVSFYKSCHLLGPSSVCDQVQPPEVPVNPTANLSGLG
jgi:hypothetical protein